MKIKSLGHSILVASTIMLIFIALLNVSRTSAENPPIVIGVPVPLTGILAETGHHMFNGITFATHEANNKGGVLGSKVEMRVEDTKGEINTAAAGAEKLITKEKVFALVGGFGSTVDYGMLQSIKGYEPLFIHAGSSAAKLEMDFGEKPWYFHIYPWDYHRQQTACNFLLSLNPKPKSVALLYEDGLYGSTANDFAQKYFKEAGLEIVMAEGFKSGSPDFSGVLNKAKSKNPDILYWVGYPHDNIQLVRQSKTLGLQTKLKMFIGGGNIRKDFGELGEGVAYIDIWSSKMKIPGLQDWLQRLNNFKPGYTPVQASVQGYTAMSVLLKAIEKAGVLDKGKIMALLEKEKFWTPFGELQFLPSQKAKHQLLNEKTIVAVQFRGDGEEVVYPPKVASAAIRYPVK